MSRRRAWRFAWRSLRRDWPAKVGAVVAALILWWVASSDPGATSQRSLLVPLEVVGAATDEVTVGVPARVEVVISGPSDRMDRLRADDVDAMIDLAGVEGEFARDIEARVPQALRVVRVVPSEVIGRLEAVRSARFDVVAHLASTTADRVATAVRVDPSEATVEARDLVLERVAYVVAPVREGADGATTSVLIAVDADGRPVAETRVVPETAQIEVDSAPRRVRAVLPVAIGSPDDPRLSVEAVTPTEVALVGESGRIADLVAIRAEVPDATSALPPGRYDLPVRLELPEGVSSEDGVSVTVRVEASASDDDEPTNEETAP